MIGVYVLFHNKKPVYVGKTECWPSRIAAHKDLIFNDARILECKKSILNATEKRLIQMLRPKYNFLHTVKGNGRKITTEWIAENFLFIQHCLKSDNHKAIHKKAVKDLGVSPRYSTTDLTGTVIRKHCKATGLDYSWKRRRFYEQKRKVA